MAAMRRRQRIVPTAEEQLGSLPPLSPEIARRFAREAREGCREIESIKEADDIEALDADDLDDTVSASAIDDDDLFEEDITRLFADLF